MSSWFPLNTRKVGSSDREVLVVWDIGDYTIPESVDPGLISNKIKSAVTNDHFIRRWKVTIWIYGDAENTWLKEMRSKLWDFGFRVHLYKGDKSAIYNYKLIGQLIFWAWNVRDPSNLLMLSENKENMEQDPKFCRLRQAFENKGFFVALALPETFINQEIVVEEPHDDSPIPYYDSASEVRGDGRPLTQEEMERFRPSFSIGRVLPDKS